MIRKMVLGAVVAIGFGGQAATAGGPVFVPPGGPVFIPPVRPGGPIGGFVPPHRHHDHDYVVLVRHRGHWDRHGRFETRFEAERAARRLEARGLHVRIEVVEGGRRW